MRKMVEKKSSPKNNFHEGREKEITIESRRKTRPQPGPTRAKRENPKQENDVESEDSTIPPTISTLLQASDSSDAEVESPGKLTARQIAAIQNDYRIGLKVKEIASLTGNSAATIYKYVKGIEPPPPPPPEQSQRPELTAPPNLPTSTLGQPTSSSSPSPPPPKIVEIPNSGEDDPERTVLRETEYEPNGRRYEQYSRQRLPLPTVDQETIGQLLMLFGNDMLRKNFLDFADYFRLDVIPRFRTLEEWEAYIPGADSAERTHNLKRYLRIVAKFFEQIKSYEESEAANNGVKLEGS